MSEKPHLTLFTTTPTDSLPRESFDKFNQWVLQDGVKPSVALHQFMEQYDCPDIDVRTIKGLLELTYPDLDIDRGGFRFQFMDANYPHCPSRFFSDNDFDDGLAYLLSHSPEQGPNAIETVFRTFKEFEAWIAEDNKKPSVALRRFMEKYHLLHSSIVLDFLVAAYPHINFSNSDLKFRIMESGYPYCKPNQFSDEDLDKGINELLENSSK